MALYFSTGFEVGFMEVINGRGILQEFRSSFDSLDEQVEQANDDLSWMKQAVLRLPDKKKKTQKIKSGR